MASSAIPAMMARQVISRLAQGGSSPAQLPPDVAGQQISAQLSELQGADPDYILKLLQQVKSALVALYPRSAFGIPGVARNVAQAMKYIDNGIKEAEQAAATASTVQNPIANQAGQPPSPTPPQGLQQFAMGAQ